MNRLLTWEGLWRKPAASWERLHLQDGHAESQLRVAAADGQPPYQLEYRLKWDADWCLREAELVVEAESFQRHLILLADGKGHWMLGDGSPLAELDGCLDIDIWPSPFTNSFPIRRLGLGDGQSAEVDVVYIEAPLLKPVQMRQGYMRQDARHYLYRNLEGSSFQALLEVDEHGLVLDYPTLFRRV